MAKPSSRAVFLYLSDMKRIPSNLLYIMLLVTGGVALFEQSSPHPRPIIVIPCMALFFIGLMVVASRIPSKKNEDDGTVQ